MFLLLFSSEVLIAGGDGDSWHMVGRGCAMAGCVQPLFHLRAI